MRQYALLPEQPPPQLPRYPCPLGGSTRVPAHQALILYSSSPKERHDLGQLAICDVLAQHQLTLLRMATTLADLQ